MVTAEKRKRPLPPKVIAMKAKKRQKLEDKPMKQQPYVRRTVLKADDLKWESAVLPDHLEMDDMPYFFGLEEVDGVDLDRDEATGGRTFSVKATPHDINGVDQDGDVEIGGKMPDVKEVRSDVEDEWFGFGSDDEASVKDDAQSDVQVKKPTKDASADIRKRSKSSRELKVKTSKQATGNFQSLLDSSDGDDADVSAWQSLNLTPDTLSSLARLKFTHPTPIQLSSIPEILDGHDVVGKASTGSGKTLAFGIPILEIFLEQRTTKPRSESTKAPIALILSPTRELAHQLDKHLTALCSGGTFEGPSIATLTGGLSVQKQQRLLKNADIVIGTPGRLWEVISEGKGVIKPLQQIQFLVVDEADRLLSEGHFKEVEEILNALDRQELDDDDGADVATKSNLTQAKPQRQTLVFSATFDRGLQKKLANKAAKPGSDLLSNKESLEYLLTKLNFRTDKPKFIDVNPVNQLATGLKEGLIECGGMEKDLYLYTLLLLHPNARALVFVNSISAVRRLTPFLQHLNLPALALHSGMVQKARMRSIERFTAPTTSSNAGTILVATDVAARGLDIPNVQLVVHYHLPRAADMYVHRSGRTARAGQPGSSILMCAPEEVAGVRRLIAKVHVYASNKEAKTGKQAKQQLGYIRTLDLDRRVASRLKPRATLAKKIADTGLAQEKGRKEDEFMRQAAEELGTEYDSDDNDAGKGKRGRGAGRKKKEREAMGLSKGEVDAMKMELKGLLKQRVNTGVSERYLTSGGLDIDELLMRRETNGREFLGSVQDLGLVGVDNR